MSDAPAEPTPPQASEPTPAPSQPEIAMPMIMSEWDQRSADPITCEDSEALRRFTD